MKPAFRLVMMDGVSKDTVTCLEGLLTRARRGEVIGIVYGELHRNRHYTVHACGEAHRNPTFARGVVGALDDHLAHQVWEVGP
jgi:hypothetical protein